MWWTLVPGEGMDTYYLHMNGMMNKLLPKNTLQKSSKSHESATAFQRNYLSTDLASS